MAGTLWIRADGSRAIGLGHLSRTSALAEAAVERGMGVQYVTWTDDLAQSFLEHRGLAAVWLAHATNLDWIASVRAGDAIVFDRYDIEEPEIRAACASGAAVALLDDHGTPSLPADLVVNPNDDVDATRLPASTVVVAGPTYALVRRAFRNRRRVRAGAHHRLIVTMGGSDTTGRGAAVVDGLAAAVPFDEVVLVEGPGAHPIDVRPPWLSVVRDPAEIAEVFDRADAAITAGGASCWELLSMGIPTAVVAVSPNQQGVATRAAAAGAALPLQPSIAADEVVDIAARLADPAVQRSLSDAALRVVDGTGAARVLDELERIARRR